MAKITYHNGLGDNVRLDDIFDINLNLQGNKSNASTVIFKDSVGADKITVTGSGFSWEGNFLETGTIKGLTFTDKTGDVTYASVTGLSLTVDKFNNAYANSGVDGIVRLVLRGDDKIIGSRNADDIQAGAGNDVVKGGSGNDTLNGGKGVDKLYGDDGRDYLWGADGNDRLWGGGKSDWFHFSSGGDKDVIVDFDARGGGRNQDYLSLHRGDDFTIKASGKDLILNFGDGDTLTLLDVRKADFTRADIDWL